jgi:hypothetical protein
MKRIKTLVLFSEIVAAMLATVHAGQSALAPAGGQDRNVYISGRGSIESDISGQ